VLEVIIKKPSCPLWLLLNKFS